MTWVSGLRMWIAGLAARRYRWILIAALITLVVSSSLLGLVGWMRWRGQRALTGDTHAVVSQAGEQLVRALQSRRGTLTLIRDTLNRRADLTSPQLEALGASATAHTRHLLGVGLIREGREPAWWFGPQRINDAGVKELNRAIVQRSRLRGVWRVPSTFVAASSDAQPQSPDHRGRGDVPPAAGGRRWLVMLEPLSGTVYDRSALIGAFDLEPLLEDFYLTRVLPRHPVQILEDDTVLYRSDDWQLPTETQQPIMVEEPMAVDAARWTVQMQPRTSRITQTLSWFSLLLIGLSILAGVGIIAVVWLLAARTWMLQRAVNRRTAALRRARDRLHQLAITDDLTGLYNRRFFLNRWTWEHARARRYKRPLACLMIDVNGFKQVNDRLGHHLGDVILRHITQELKTLLRESDILARFGGDEFIVALPETSPAQAKAVAEKLRQVKIPVPDGVRHGLPAVTLSVGISQLGPRHAEPQNLLQDADASLYAAKRRGKTAAAKLESSASLSRR